MAGKTLQLAVLISGGGRTLLNLHKCIESRSIYAEINIVICSRSDAPGVNRAKAKGLSTIIISPREEVSTFHDRITQAVSGVDLVCMAGFLSKWQIPDEMSGRVINIHPALLPDFGGKGMYGLRVHEAVIQAGHTRSGCTVHYCDNEYDHGPVILQHEVSVLPDDTPKTLADRVFEKECIAYPEAIRLFAEGRIHLEGRKVTIS